MGFWSDQFSENTGGKYSSKKFWGFIIMFLVCTAFIISGFAWYTVNEPLFNSMLISGTALLGLRTLGKIFEKKNGTESK